MTKQTDNKTKVENLGKMPRLRFPEFQGKWETKEIGQIMKIGSGKDYKHLGEGDIPVFGTGGYMTSVNDYLMNGETICIGRKGTINKPFYHCGKFWTVDTLFYTHSFKNTIPRFALYIFEKINWLQYNEASGVPSLSKSTIEQIEISIPFLPEQKKIASLLSLIDERIECQRKIINQLETAMRIIREKIFKQQMRFTREKTQWKELKLDDFTDIKKGEQLNKEDLTEKGIYPCLNGGVNFSGYTDKYNTNANTITISEGGNSCGYVNFLTSNFWLGGHCYKIVPKSTINLIYFYHLLKFNEDKIMKLRIGSGLPNIQQKDLRNFKVSITVSSEEQTKIANFLTSLDVKIETEKQLLEQYKQQKTYLLQNLFI